MHRPLVPVSGSSVPIPGCCALWSTTEWVSILPSLRAQHTKPAWAWSESGNDCMLWGEPWKSSQDGGAERKYASRFLWRETTMPVQVLLADDHQLVRQGLKVLLEREGFSVVAEASNGHEAVRLAQEHHPHVAVVDLVMPLLNGVDAVREIQRVSPDTKTIILTMLSENHYILEALKSGAKGFVMKTHASEDLVQAIREAARGRTYLSPEVSQTVVQAYQDKVDLRPDPLSPRERQVLQLIAEGKSTKEVASFLHIRSEVSQTVVQAYQDKVDLRPDPLSPRERQVLQLIAEGKSTKEVASFLHISVKTAETHRTRIMGKLDIHETAGLVRYAIRRGLTQA